MQDGRYCLGMANTNHTPDHIDHIARHRVANTILAQLGGFLRISAMLGIKATTAVTVDGCHGLTIDFKAGRQCKRFTVLLDLTDTYTVQFYGPMSRTTYTRKLLGSVADVYASSLRGVVEQGTGCYLSL